MKYKKWISIPLLIVCIQYGVHAQEIIWKKLTSLPQTCAGGGAAVIGHKIYFIASSHSTRTSTNDFYVYDIAADKWQQLANIPDSRGNMVVAGVLGKVLVIGGDPFTNTNFEYNPETNTWDTLSHLPTPRQHIDEAIVNDKIYVIGGLVSPDGTFQSATISKKNEVYNVATDSWEEKVPIPTLRNNPAVAVLDSLIYVIGGAGSENDIWKTIATVEAYNPLSDKWITKSDLPDVIFKPAALNVNGQLFVLGGQNKYGQSISSVMVYDQKSDTWKYTTNLPKINCFAGYAVVNNKIYVIGGTNSDPDWTYYADVYEGTVLWQSENFAAVTDNEHQSHSASFTGLGDLPGGTFSSSVKGVSDDGRVIVGYGTNSSGEEAFMWTEPTGMVGLGNLPEDSFKNSWANKVSADGNVIVGYGDPVGQGWNTYKGFVWTRSDGMREIGILDTSKRSMAWCVSANGKIIAGDGGPAAFQWTKESQTKRMEVLPGRTHSRIIDMSADGKVMIGQSYSLPEWNNEDGFIMSEDGKMQSMSSLTGGKYTMVLAVSPDGSVVAGTTYASSYPAFFWTKDKGMVTIGHLPERNTTHPGDMTPFGKIIVGGSFSGPDNGDAFIWDSIHGMRNLKTVLQSEYGLDLYGWKLLNASGITPDGNVIVGDAINPQGQKEGFRLILDTTLMNVRTGHDLAIQENFPSLIYSTIIGGSKNDFGHAIAVDKEGFAYIAGQANSPDYPITSLAFDTTHNGGADILVTKLNQNGSALIYSTFIGGTDRDDGGDIMVDESGCVYVSGGTRSPDFPVTNNSMPGNSESYIIKLDKSGNKLEYSGRWSGGHIILDHDKNIIIAGATTSPVFPTTEDAYSRKIAGGKDVFVAKVNTQTNKIIFSSLIGGNSDEGLTNVAFDKENNIIIAGITKSDNFPLKGKPFAEYDSAKSNVFVAKIKSDGSQLISSTIIGGNMDDHLFDMAVDKNGDVYGTGVTKSSNFPITQIASNVKPKAEEEAFVFKLNPEENKLLYSVLIGGSLKDVGRGITVDKKGKAYITGCTKSDDFPVTHHAFDKTFNGAGSETWAWGDPFLLVLNPEGTQIEYSTFFGGSSDEEAYDIAMDPKGDVYICGVTSSDDFPTTKGAYDRTKNGSTNIYVSKFQFFDSIKR